MKLAKLQPAVRALRTATASPIATERMRGRGLQQRNRRFLHENPLCAECHRQGRVSAAIEVDHIAPLWDGGADRESNLQGLCIPCHEAKTGLEAARRAAGGRVESNSGLGGNRRPSHAQRKNPPLEPGYGA